jgi:hypothetical protein
LTTSGNMLMSAILTSAPGTVPGRTALCIAMLGLHAVLMTIPAKAAEESSDRGRELVGKIKATLYLGSNDAPEKLGALLAPVDQSMQKRLRNIKQMHFQHYHKLGSDTQPIFRSYENWLTPLSPSEEILLSFESQGRAAEDGMRLDLELWQHRRKVMKSNPVLHVGRPLLILGPKWRGGTMIIAVELVENSL